MESLKAFFESRPVRSVVITGLTLAALMACRQSGDTAAVTPTPFSSSADPYSSSAEASPNFTRTLSPSPEISTTPHTDKLRAEAIIAEACSLYRQAASAAGSRYQEQIINSLGEQISQLEYEYNAMFKQGPEAEAGPNEFHYRMMAACPEAYPPAKNAPQRPKG